MTKRPNAIIEHVAGEETQFDWVELPGATAGWTFPTKRAYVLVGSFLAVRPDGHGIEGRDE